MNALATIPVPTQEEFDIATIASLVRTIEQAPLQNRLPIFAMIVRVAIGDLATRRQQAIDDLWVVAREVGLVDLLGVELVQEALAAEFDRGRA